jgi:uncharacterized damage-inducible protein DinB
MIVLLFISNLTQKDFLIRLDSYTQFAIGFSRMCEPLFTAASHLLSLASTLFRVLGSNKVCIDVSVREKEYPTMDKDNYLETWDHEQKTTEKILKAFPADKSDLKPAEKSRSAKELAWVFVIEQAAMIEGVIKGQVDFRNIPPMPNSYPEIVSKFESEYPKLVARVKAMSESDWNSSIDFPTGPGKMGKLRKRDLLWMSLHDMIHHRGQLSVYLRMAGAKVPSIYGPSADEPWQ